MHPSHKLCLKWQYGARLLHTWSCPSQHLSLGIFYYLFPPFLLIWSEHLPFMIAVGALHAQRKHNYAQLNCDDTEDAGQEVLQAKNVEQLIHI